MLSGGAYRTLSRLPFLSADKSADTLRAVFYRQLLVR